MLLPATTFSLPDSSGLQAGPGPEARALCQTHQPAGVVWLKFSAFLQVLSMPADCGWAGLHAVSV